jgi:histidyl-tRNA synthetase
MIYYTSIIWHIMHSEIKKNATVIGGGNGHAAVMGENIDM